MTGHSEKWNLSLDAGATSDNPRASQVLFYTCHHVTDAITGLRIGWVPAGAHVKDILTVCPECAKNEPRAKRLDPYDWADTGQHSI